MAKKKKEKRTNLNATKQFAKQRNTALIVSLCNVIVLLFLGYILNNQAIFTREDLNKYAWMELIKERLGLSKGVEKSNEAVFVNVAYDKQLIERHDIAGWLRVDLMLSERIDNLKAEEIWTWEI